MLKLNPNPTFWVDVNVRKPGGEVDSFKIEFRHKTRAGLRQFMENGKGKDDADYLVESGIVAGWQDVDAEFSNDNLKALVDNYPGIAGVLLLTYPAELMKASAGN